MTREDLVIQIQNYVPCNEQEERDKELILKELERSEAIFTREDTTAHITASAWVLNKAHDRVLMAYHNIFDSWSWLGGHADGETDLLSVALREITEESGIKSVRPITTDIFSLEVLTVDGHVKRGKYVSSHLHLNITYLLEADDSENLLIKPDENSGVAWYSPKEALEKSTETWFIEHIYSKLNEKMKKYI